MSNLPSVNWFTDLFTGGNEPETRFAPNFNGSDQYATFPRATFTGDFAFSFELQGGGYSNNAIIGEEGSESDFMRLVDNSSIRIHQGGNILLMPLSQSLPSSGVYNLKINRESGTIKVLLNDAEIGSASFPHTFEFDCLAKKGTNFFYGGLMYNVKLSDALIFNMDDGDGIMRNSGTGTNGAYVSWSPTMWQEIAL